MARTISTRDMGLRAVGVDDYQGADPSMSTDTQFTRGLKAGLIGGSGLFGDGASALMAEALKAYESGDNETGRVLETQARELMRQAQEVGPRVTDVRDVRSLGDAADWVGGAMGSGAASIGQSVAGGLAGAGAGALAAGPVGAMVGGAAGAFGAGYGPAVDEQIAKAMQDEAIRANRTPEEILGTARAAGAFNAGLDAAGAGVTALGRKVLTRAGAQALGARGAGSVVEDVAKDGAAKYVAKRVGESVAGEAATGAAQSVVGQVAQNDLAGRDGIDWGDVAADAAAEGVGGAIGGAPAVAQAAYGKAVGGAKAAKEKVTSKSIFEHSVDLGEKVGEAAAGAVEKVEVALARAVKPTAADPDFFTISQPIDPALGDEEVLAAGDNRVQAAARLAAKLRDNKGASVEERELGVKFEADMAAGDPDVAVNNLRDGFASTQQKKESKSRVTSVLSDFIKGGRKANAMSLPEDGPDDMDQVMSIWQEKMADGDSAFADTIDDPEVSVARRAFAEWVKNDFRDPDTGRLFIPRGMADTLGKQAGVAVKEAFTLLQQQGLIADKPELTANAERMVKALNKLGERSDTSLKMIKDTFTPLALRKIGPANLDNTATQVQAVMQRLASGQIEMTPPGMAGLVELFGTEKRVKELLKQFKEGRSAKESYALDKSGMMVDQDDDEGGAADTGIGGDLEETDGNVKTVFHGPFDLKDEANRERLAKRMGNVSGASPSAAVKEVGLWDKLKSEHSNPDELFAAEQQALMERGVDLNSLDADTRTRMLKRLNKTVRFVQEASVDDSDKLDRVNLRDLREKAGAQGRGTPDTVSEGRLYLEREVEVEDPNASETITEDGEIVRPKKKERRAFLTSTSKLLKHANRSGDKLTEAGGAREVGDKVLAALGALMASGNGFTGRVGFRSSADTDVQWQDAPRTLPAALRLTEDTRMGDARYNSTGSKPATSWVEDVTRADLRDMNDDDLTQFIEDTMAELKGATAARKKQLQSMIDHAQDLLDNGPAPERVIDDPASMAEPFRLNEERPAKPVERGADGNVAKPAPVGKLATGSRPDDLWRPMVGNKAGRKQVEWLVGQLRKGVPALTAAINGMRPEQAVVARQALVELASMDPRDQRLVGLINDFAAFQKRISAALQAVKSDALPAKQAPAQPAADPREAFVRKLLDAGKGAAPTIAKMTDAQLNAAMSYVDAALADPNENGLNGDVKKLNALHELMIDENSVREEAFEDAVLAEKFDQLQTPDDVLNFARRARDTFAELREAKDLSSGRRSIRDALKRMFGSGYGEFDWDSLFDGLKATEDQRAELDRIVAGAKQMGAEKASRQSAGKTEATPEEIAAVEKEILDTLGDKIKTAFKKKVVGDDGKRVSGLWDDAKQLISIALNADDPMGVGRHEAMHALFSKMNAAGVSEMRDVLERVASTKMMQGKLRRLLQDHPRALEQLGDPEEAAAYMYQFWRAGMLQVGPQTNGFFQKVMNWLREATRLVRAEVRDERHAEMIMGAFADGAFKDDAGIAAINEAIREDIAKYERNLLTTFQGSKVLKNFVFTADSVLRDSKNPHLVKLADQFATREGGTVGETPSYFDAVPAERAKWLNRLNNIFRDADVEDAQLALKHLQAETLPGKINDPVIRDLVNKTRQYLEDMYDYMSERGVQRWNDEAKAWEPIPRIKKNYFPRVWDVDAIVDRAEEFMQLLVDNHAENLDFIAKQAGMEPSEETRQAVAEAIIKQLVDGSGAPDITESTTSLGITPFQQALNRRSLNWIEPSLFEPFMSKDLAKIMTGYSVQAVKRAEYTYRFGNEGEHIQKTFDKALEHEIAEKDSSLHEEIGEAVTKAQAEWQEKQKAGVDAGAWPTFRSVALMKFSAREEVSAAMNKLAEPIKAVMAAEGTLGRNITDKKRQVFNYVTTYQNFRLLTLSLFSSLSDVGGIVVRGGTVDDAYRAFVAGVQEVVKGWKNETTRDGLTKLAEEIGTVDAGTFMDDLGQMHSSQFMEGKLRRLNDKLFKWNGMEAWNRAMRVQATGAAARFIERHLTKPTKHSERYLKDELGLREEADAYLKNGRLDTDNPAVQQAIVRWVNGAILRPNAMQRPVMASDPHYQLFYHLKQFTYSFHKVILARTYNEAKHGNFTPMAALLAGYVPMVIAADIMKELLVPGDEPAWMKGGIGDVVAHGIGRANLLGVPQMGFDAVEFAWKRGNPLEMSGLFGPAPDQVMDWLMVPLTEAHTVGGELLRAAPATAVVSRAATLAD